MADIQDGEPTVAMTLARRLAHYRNRAAPTDVELAERTVAQRSRPGITQRELSARMAALGFEMSREAIANVESGGRPDSKNTNKTRAEAVTVTELLGLALALNVPPPLLVAPLGDSEAVRVGGLVIHPHALVDWLCAEGGILSAGDKGPLSHDIWEWYDNAEPLRDFRRLRELIDATHWAETEAERNAAENPGSMGGQRTFDSNMLILDDVMRRLARAGVSTPELPDHWVERIVELRNRRGDI